MKLERILANAIARRIAYVIVAAALAWLGLSDAKAQMGVCQSNPSGCTRQQAYDACMVYLPALYIAGNYGYRCHTTAAATAPSGTYTAQRNFNGGTYSTIVGGWRWDGGCGAGNEWNQYLNQCKKTCTSRTTPQIVTFSSMIPNGSIQCHDGCEALVSPLGDGTYQRTTIQSSGSICGTIPNDCSNFGPNFSMNYGTGMCQPKPQECAENQTKDPVTGVCEQGCAAGMVMDANGVCKPKQEDCPPGNVRAPSGQCLPGDGQCAAGEARRPNGTCGIDADGDGEADEDDEDPENDPEKEFFAGGDNCASPPSCSGGVIECGQARIQWRIDCNTRRTVNITGGACNAMPLCVGENCKAMEYAQLLQQWKASCALEKMADKEAGEGGNEDLIKLLTDPGSIQPDLGGTGDMPGGGAYAWGDDEEEFDPDTGGFGWSSSCPANPTVNVFGATLTFNLSPLCQWVGLGGYLVLILSSLACVRIISGGNA